MLVVTKSDLVNVTIRSPPMEFDAVSHASLRAAALAKASTNLATAMRTLLCDAMRQRRGQVVGCHGRSLPRKHSTCRRLPSSGQPISPRRMAGMSWWRPKFASRLAELGKVVGAVYTDDLLDRIFRTFCIGK